MTPRPGIFKNYDKAISTLARWLSFGLAGWSFVGLWAMVARARWPEAVFYGVVFLVAVWLTRQQKG